MTDDCPTPFFRNHLLPPRVLPSGFDWVYFNPDLDLTLSFPTPMDTTHQPLPAQFIILVDGVPKTPDLLFWIDPVSMAIAYAEPSLAPSVVRLIYSEASPLFHDLTEHQVFPFDILGVQA